MFLEVRKRNIYRVLRQRVDDTLNEYWVTLCDVDAHPEEYVQSCEKLTLAAFKLLKYVRNSVNNIDTCIDDRKISDDVNDICGDYYCLGEGESTSFQEESDALELLSRTAYREMKKAKKYCRSCKERYPGDGVFCKNCGEPRDSVEKIRTESRS